MAALQGAIESRASKPQRRRKKNVLFYAMVIFAICWIQLTANIVVYFWRNGNDSGFDSRRRFGRFPLQDGSFVGNSQPGMSQSNNLRSGKQTIDFRGESSLIALSLEAELLELSKRLEHVRENLEEESKSGLNGASSKTQKVFVPFTIRDAQRTVPTQIPYGFEVFDFIDLYATNGDQNQTASLQRRVNEKNKTNSPDDSDNHPNDSENDHNMLTTKAKLYRNGKPISVDDSIASECLDYSKQCYRSKFLQVIQHLLTNAKKNENIEYYYFYMEADNDLCVPLSDIRDIAFQYQRYFVSTGTGASGWIMSQRFLQDFYSFWKTLDKQNTQGLTETEIFEPDSVAAVLLQRNSSWSVTRRYLTSHSILTGNTNDAASIEALFHQVDRIASKNGDSTSQSETQNEKVTENAKKKKESPEEAAKKAPLMEPSRYLPRCLEPHHGVWKNRMGENEDENNIDRSFWEFFDYDLCPDSDVFPCAEGQLNGLAKAIE